MPTTRSRSWGFRVEPGEVEAVLTRHPAVGRAAVVAARAATDGERQLVAYVVPGGDRTRPPSEADLRAHAQRELAEYLVPAAFVVLDALPLTASGKLDRAALPEPSRARATAATAPGGGTVHALCALFADVLNVTEVGADDDFFGLGGHSLLAARVLGRVRATLGAELDLRTLFDAPTPAALAPHVEAAPGPPRPRRARTPPPRCPSRPRKHASGSSTGSAPERRTTCPSLCGCGARSTPTPSPTRWVTWPSGTRCSVPSSTRWTALRCGACCPAPGPGRPSAR
ncbi:2-succinylbenzoate--CoA ligase [Streptomyces alboniger]